MATIYDIAKAVGMSTKTVSRVLNNEGPVKKETREAVERAMAKVGYVPSLAARMMRSKRSGLIGLITGGISALNIDEATGLPEIFVVRGIQAVMQENGLTSLITDTGGHTEQVPHLIRTLLEHRVEGFIYVGDHHSEVTLPEAVGSPKIVLANCYDTKGTPSFVPDDRRGQRELTHQLIKIGHRRIAYLTLPEHFKATRLRKAGYRDALQAAGIDYDPALIRVGDDATDNQDTVQLDTIVDELLDLPSPPSVLCCGNDKMAMSVYGILRVRGLSIPKDISVAGYDNYRLIAEQLYPPLTTVELPYIALGARAAECLLAMIGGESPTAKRPIRVNAPVRWRESVAPPFKTRKARTTAIRKSTPKGRKGA